VLAALHTVAHVINKEMQSAALSEGGYDANDVDEEQQRDITLYSRMN
jgi:hypothetical protein